MANKNLLEGLGRKIELAFEGAECHQYAFAIFSREGIEKVVTRQASTETAFPICSITKPFTAALLLMILEEQGIDPSKVIRAWVPDDCPFGQVSFAQVLSMTAGIFDDESFEGKPASESGLWEALKRNPAVKIEQGVFLYSNLAYSLAGHLIEKLSGVNYSNQLDLKLLQPLGLKRSSINPREIADVVSEPSGGFHPGDNSIHGFNRASGGLFCSVADLATFGKALLNGGLSEGRPVIPKGVIDAMSFIHGDAVTLPFRYYGLGLGVEFWQGYRVIHHGGGLPNFGSYMNIIPELGFGVVSLFNAPQGYAVHPYSILTEMIHDSGDSAPPKLGPRPVPVGGQFKSIYGDLIDIEFLEGSVLLKRNNESHRLSQLSSDMYQSSQGLCLGLLNLLGNQGYPHYISLNEFPIGYVSALPYIRVENAH